MLIETFSRGDSALLALVLATGLLLLAVSQFVRIPYPIVLVLGGALLGFLPGAPEVHLNPDLVLVAVLPPLLYGGAFFTSLRELRANVKAIGTLAVGLVQHGYGAGSVGAAMASYTACVAGFVVFGGVFADRFNTRHIMIGADVVRIGTQSTAAALLSSIPNARNDFTVTGSRPDVSATVFHM